MWEWVVWGECGEEGSDFVEDDKAEVAEGDDGFDLAFAKEEGYTDAFDKEVERLVHVVGEEDGDFVVRCNRREGEDVMKVLRTVEM